MDSSVFIGHHCPRCKTTVGVTASIGGGDPRCPGCGGPLIAAGGGPKTTVIANAKCTRCSFSAGLYSAVGGDAACPKCGGQLEGE